GTRINNSPTPEDSIVEGGIALHKHESEFPQCACRRKQHSDRSGNRAPSIAHRKLLHKSPPISSVTERLIKLVRVFARKPRVQRTRVSAFCTKSFSAEAIRARPIPRRRTLGKVTRARIRPDGSSC